MSYNLTYTNNGTWTPVITGIGSAGTGTYTTRAGFYTKIGNLVFLTATIVWTAHTGTGDMTITSLPFTSKNQSNYNPEGILNINVTLPASTITVLASLAANSTTAILQVVKDGANNAPIQMANAGTIHLTLTYLT